MNTIITIFAIFSLAYFVKETDGPFGVMGSVRNKLITNQYVGSFFYKLLDCWFCTGCWAGGIIYFFAADSYKLLMFPVWFLAGGGICLVINSILEKLWR